MTQKLVQFAVLYLAAVNVTAFLLMGIDKYRARRDLWRISEKTLFLSAALGGALGGLLGMRVFRHKTRHWYFRWGFSALLAVWVVLLGLVIWRSAGK